jgi:hypothetical protein
MAERSSLAEGSLPRDELRAQLIALPPDACTDIGAMPFAGPKNLIRTQVLRRRARLEA